MRKHTNSDPSLWRSRPKEIGTEIDRAFNLINKQEKGKWGLYNGQRKYKLAGLADEILIDKVITNGICRGRTKFVFIDIGAGEFQWGDACARYIRTHPLFKNTVEVKIYSLRGEKNLEQDETTDNTCQHYKYGNFQVEKLIDGFNALGLDLINKADLIASSWCLLHLVDPVGTIEQACHLLNPEGGLFLFDGFHIDLDSDTNDSSAWDDFKPKQVGKIEQILSKLNCNFFMLDDNYLKRVNCFIAEKCSHETPSLLSYLSYKAISKHPTKKTAFFATKDKAESTFSKQDHEQKRKRYTTYNTASNKFFERLIKNHLELAQRYRDLVIRLFKEWASSEFNNPELREKIAGFLVRIIKYAPDVAIDCIKSMLTENDNVAKEILNTSFERDKTVLYLTYKCYRTSNEPQAKENYMELIKLLLEYMSLEAVNIKFKPYEYSRSITLLLHAVEMRSPEIVEILLRSPKVDASIKDSDGRSLDDIVENPSFLSTETGKKTKEIINEYKCHHQSSYGM